MVKIMATVGAKSKTKRTPSATDLERVNQRLTLIESGINWIRDEIQQAKAADAEDEPLFPGLIAAQKDLEDSGPKLELGREAFGHAVSKLYKTLYLAYYTMNGELTADVVKVGLLLGLYPQCLVQHVVAKAFATEEMVTKFINNRRRGGAVCWNREQFNSLVKLGFIEPTT